MIRENIKAKREDSKENRKIVEEVMRDFHARADARRSFDTIWQLNMNYLMGNQYCDVGYGGLVEETDKQFFWQEREVFNHIAPIFDIRFAKLSKIKQQVHVLPATNDERDKQTAKISNKILNSVGNKLGLPAKINQAIKWSEVCGTSFYKVNWNPNAGQLVGLDEDGLEIRGGEIDISVCSPFEIYPDSNTCETIDDCQSIIHARAYTLAEIKDMYGIEVESERLNTFALDSVTAGMAGLGFNGMATKVIESVREDSALVIEKYIRPNKDFPEGRLIIIAGKRVVYDGSLPYFCGEDGKRDLPFVKQVSIEQPACFWGASVIERIIPVQRAYNAVKNRKHEFINRLSLGVLSVEDGSVDLDNLEDEGLCPGKVLVYRQGSNEPKYLQTQTLPADFNEEEKRLNEEFYKIGGISETLGSEYVSSNLSGVTLELLIGQDEIRLNSTIESIKSCYKEISKRILRLYKQYALFPRIARIAGDNGQIELFYFNSNDISSDDVEIETMNDSTQTLTQKREMVFALLNSGVLSDENGKLSKRMKYKVLESLGLGVWENAQDLNELHIKKADNENIRLLGCESVAISEIDDHELHINEHIAFMLGNDYEKAVSKDKNLEEKFLSHVREHKKAKEV